MIGAAGRVTEHGDSEYVLDAFAVVALVYREPGYWVVEGILRRGAQGSARVSVTVVNWGEALYVVQRRSGVGSAADLVVRLDEVPVEVVGVGRELAIRAAQFKVFGGISYADCYAAALADLRHATLVTGDPEFGRVGGQLAIEWLPQRRRN